MEDGNGTMTLEAQRGSFVDHVLAYAEDAKTRVRSAIESYTTQRREAEEAHTRTLAEIDGAVVRLRQAIGEGSPTPKRRAGARRPRRISENAIWKLSERYLREHGPMTTKGLAEALGKKQSAVIPCFRGHDDVFAIYGSPEGQMVSLRA